MFVFVCFAFRAGGAAGRLPVFASPANHTCSSRGFYVPITPHSCPPDHPTVDGREEGFSRETYVAQPENEKKTKNEKKRKNRQGCAREPDVSPDALQLSHRDRRVGCVDSPPADILGGGAAAEKTKGYL